MVCTPCQRAQFGQVHRNGSAHPRIEVTSTDGGDQLDVPLEDSALLEEVELISALMIAASESREHLDQDAIDSVLGVPARRPTECLSSRGAASPASAPVGAPESGYP